MSPGLTSILHQKRGGLRDFEANYRLIAEGLPQFVWVSTKDHKLEYFNPHMAQYLGLGSDVGNYEGWIQSILPADLFDVGRATQLPPLNTACDSKESCEPQPYDVEVRIRRSSDASCRWHSVRVKPFKCGDVWKWLGTALDVEDRHDAERARTLLASMVESASDAFVGLDAEARITTYNAAAQSLFGLRDGEAVGWPMYVLNPAASQERIADHVRRAFHGERVEWSDSLTRPSDGAELTVQCSIYPIRAHDGAVVAAFQTFRDLTGQRLIERNLIAANERLRLVQRAVKAGTWEIDIDSGLVYRSPELRELYGMPPGEDLSPEAEWTRFVHPEDAARVRRAIELAIENHSELRLQYRARLSGDTRWVTAVGSVVPDDCRRMVGITIDTTDFHKAEEALRHAVRLDSIGRLAGGVAHDFNNLLAGILGGASFIADVIPEDHPARPMLDLVIRSSERAAHLTQQLLAYAGKGNFMLRKCDVTTIVQDAFPLLRGALPHNVELVVQTGWNLPRIDADSNQLREALVSLVSNAGEAIGETEGSVWVRTGVERIDSQSIESAGLDGRPFSPSLAPDTYVYLEVKDDGPGIAPEIQKRIFEPFFTTRFTGRGLGLSAVEGIVRGHHGSIEVRSLPGEGAAFRIYFPALEIAREAASPRPKDADAAAAVLVIDDEDAVRNIISAKLELSGYDVMLAADGVSGLEKFRAGRKRISLVILDVGMPGMSGADVFDELIRCGIDVPVIVTSGYQEAEALARIGPSRIAGFLQKPFSVGELSRLVSKLTGRDKLITR